MTGDSCQPLNSWIEKRGRTKPTELLAPALYSAQLSIVAQIKDKAGTVLEKFGEDIPYRGALEQIQKAKSQVVTLQRHFDAPPGEYVIEVAIQDRLGGKVGAQRIPFEIADESGGPSLSDTLCSC